jgi:predicted Rossmann fold nucleotide-binding protein DprA/Smf involved in DNA uptake
VLSRCWSRPTCWHNFPTPGAGPGADAPDGLAPLPDGLGPLEYTVAELLGAESVSLDQLIGRSGLRPGQILAALSILEIAGVVEQQAGRRFRRM